MCDDAATLQRAGRDDGAVIPVPESVPAVWPVAGAGHRVELAGTAWSVWRDVALRSAGLPADKVLALCDEPLARSADLAGTDPAGRLAYDKAYADAADRLSRAIAGTYADPVFREALTWQNPGLAQRLQGAGTGTSRRSKDRGRELVVASYLQRYCLKNDTIGFFGPVGWATVDPGTAGLTVVPGEQLIARRTTYFEVWAIDKVAAAIAAAGAGAGLAAAAPDPVSVSGRERAVPPVSSAGYSHRRGAEGVAGVRWPPDDQ